MPIKQDSFIVQQPYLPDDTRWYVQRVGLLDYGRFATEQEAIDHKKFCEDKF